ncbi:hypothetical protein BV22DRAFT_980624, partial [Leucogyrophana mollusca]
AFGYVISLGFFGILLAQTFIYHTRFPGDSSWMKAYVWFIVLLECLSCALGLYIMWIGSEMHCVSCLVSSLYGPGVTGYWPWICLSVLTGLIVSLVHGFFSWRIWVIGKSLYVPIMVMTVRVNFNSEYWSALPMFRAWSKGALTHLCAILFWLGGSLICDVIITFETTRWLLKNSRTGFRETHSLVLKLVKLTIETGMVTTVAILLELLLLQFLGTFVHFSVYHSYNSLLPHSYFFNRYANCLLATLNARLVISKDS